MRNLSIRVLLVLGFVSLLCCLSWTTACFAEACAAETSTSTLVNRELPCPSGISSTSIFGDQLHCGEYATLELCQSAALKSGHKKCGEVCKSTGNSGGPCGCRDKRGNRKQCQLKSAFLTGDAIGSVTCEKAVDGRQQCQVQNGTCMCERLCGGVYTSGIQGQTAPTYD
jgi:hypothetical protein